MISQIQVKNDLKKIGCKLKSQLDGCWAIHEAKGNRIVVQTLEEAHQYYLSKSSSSSNPSVSAKNAPAPLKPVAQLVKQGVPSVDRSKPKESDIDQNATVTVEVPARLRAAGTHLRNTHRQDPRVSAELKASIEKADHVVGLLKERRLKMGINVSHADLRTNLISKICPAELLEDVMAHVVSSLENDCNKKLLVKRHFKNHLNEDDVMYFDFRYTDLLS